MTASALHASAATPGEACMPLHTAMNTAPARVVNSDCRRDGQRVSQKAVIPSVNTAETALSAMILPDNSCWVAKFEIGTSDDEAPTTARMTCADRSNLRCCKNAVISSNWSGAFNQVRALPNSLIAAPREFVGTHSNVAVRALQVYWWAGRVLPESYEFWTTAAMWVATARAMTPVSASSADS